MRPNLARVMRSWVVPPHPIQFLPGDPNRGRRCSWCGFNVPMGFRYAHADWCAKRPKRESGAA